MRKKLLLLILPLAVLFASCSKDGDNIFPSVVIDEVANQFKKDYPNAVDVKWDIVDDYAVAQFNLGTQTKSSATAYTHKAWYKNHKEYAHRKYMWEREIDYKDLPVAVKTAFENSIYVNWEIDDVEEIIRYEMEPIYSIEVEGEDINGKEIEVDLYYDITGVLIKEVIDSDDDFDKHHGMIVDKELPGYIKDFLNEYHKNGRVVDVDVEDDDLDEIEGNKDIKHWEVEIVEGGIKKEVIFSFNPVSWIYTKWEVESELPGFILDAVAENYYPEYELDDDDEYDIIVHHVEGLLYKVELEYEGDGNEEDLYVYFNENGEVVLEVEND